MIYLLGKAINGKERERGKREGGKVEKHHQVVEFSFHKHHQRKKTGRREEENVCLEIEKSWRKERERERERESPRPRSATSIFPHPKRIVYSISPLVVPIRHCRMPEYSNRYPNFQISYKIQIFGPNLNI